MLIVLVIVGAVAVMYALLRLVGVRSPLVGGQEAVWEDRILRLTRDNRGAMERAVTARKRKLPQATRLELLKMVHDEYVKDRE